MHIFLYLFAILGQFLFKIKRNAEFSEIWFNQTWKLRKKFMEQLAIENLFTHPKLLTECKNNRVSRFCDRFTADRYTLKMGFSLYKIVGENATF